MNKLVRTILNMAVLGLLVSAAACSGSPAARPNSEGNDAFKKAAFDEAWAAYQTAQIEDPELAEPYYNSANALYRQGLYAEALQEMQKALAFADQADLAAQGYYNHGNSAYNTADMQAAVDSYIQALLRDPDDQDAKHNLELALQQLSEQQQQEQQQQQNDEQSGEYNPEQQDDQNQSDEGQQEQQDSQNQDDQSGESDTGEESEQEQQGEDEQADQSGQQGDQQPEQAGTQNGGQDGEQDGYNVMPEPGERLSADQARQLLAAIGRSSQTLQERLGAIFAGDRRPPAQDW